MKRFTVLLPMHNCEATIEKTLISLQNQTFKDFCVCIVDNNSIDRSVEIVESFIEENNNFYLIREAQQGISFALNSGINSAHSEYVARIDGDDIADPMWLAWADSYISKNPKIALFSFNYKKIDSEDQEIGFVMHPTDNKSIIPLLLVCSPIAHPGAIIKTPVVKKLMYRNRFAEDHDLWCRIAVCHELGNVEKFGIQYRIGENSLSKVNATRIRRSVFFNALHLAIWAPRKSILAMRKLRLDELSTFETLPLRRVELAQRALLKW